MPSRAISYALLQPLPRSCILCHMPTDTATLTDTATATATATVTAVGSATPAAVVILTSVGTNASDIGLTLLACAVWGFLFLYGVVAMVSLPVGAE